MKNLIKRKKILAVSAGLALLLSFAGMRVSQAATAIEYGLIVALISIFSNIDIPVEIARETDSDGSSRVVFDADLASSAHKISVQASSDGSVQLRDANGNPVGEVSVRQGVVTCSSGRID